MPRTIRMSNRSIGAATKIDPHISIATGLPHGASCSKKRASWSGMISATAARATKRPLRNPSRSPDRHAIRPRGSNSATSRSNSCSARSQRSSAIAWSTTGWNSMQCRSDETSSKRANNRQNPEMVVAHNDETRPVAIRAGNFELRLAESDAEIEAAQALRYRVFTRRWRPRRQPEMAAARRDF